MFDRGASHHMTGADVALRNVRPCHPVQIKLAEGGKCVALTVRTAEIQGKAGAAAVHLTLADVLVVPGLAVYFFSVRVATKHDYQVTFPGDGVGVYIGSELLLSGHRRGNFYVLNEERRAEGFAAVLGSAHTWHQRFAHASGGTLAAVPAAVTGMEITSGELRKLLTAGCEPCIRGKMNSMSFRTSDSHSAEPLALFHTDLNGPMPIPTPDGLPYEVVLFDDNSKYKAVVAVKKKGAPSDVVMDVMNRWKTQLGTKAKVIRQDGGKEYTGKSCEKWRSEKGIVIHVTTRYTPEQNGVAECDNRTLSDLANRILARKWWGEAAQAMTYVTNRTPNLGETATPYEQF